MQWSMKSYFVLLVDRAGNTQIIIAHEMDKITEALGSVNTMAAMKLFPQMLNYSDILQPEGKVDLLTL